MGEDRLYALRDPASPYFSLMGEIIKAGMAENARAEASRTEIIVPIALGVKERAELSRRFGWKVICRDYGFSGRFPPFVQALVYLMSLRNYLLVGNDGEEFVFIDGDLPAMVAKNMTYGHVCRTHATSRLAAGYASERSQLERLALSDNMMVAAGAKTVIRSLGEGDGVQVCNSAATCTRAADTVFFNHAYTPVSLRQAVATAKAHGAGVVRGVCFFQAEMLMVDEGELTAFPGRFIVDRDLDVITLIPRDEPSLSFSHPYSSLVSFFLNHEVLVDGERWLVEKHLSGDGVFHYLARKEAFESSFPDTLTANYYRSDLTKWMEFEYTSWFDDTTGVLLGSPQRRRVRVLEYAYRKVMSKMLTIDPKHLSYDEVYRTLATHNNVVVSNGECVTVPQRVWYDELRRVAVPLFGLILARREASSFELKESLSVVRQRFGLRDASWCGLFWAGICRTVDSLARQPVSGGGLEDAASLASLSLDGQDWSVKKVDQTDRIRVSAVSGAEAPGYYGRVEKWLPGRSRRNVRVLSRAADYFRRAGAVFSDSESERSMPAADSGDVDVDHTVLVDVAQVEVSDKPVKLEGKRLELAQRLMATQDASRIRPPVRMVTKYVGEGRTDVAVLPVLTEDPVPVAQAEYDDLFPGVSLSDEEAKQVLAAESDIDKRVEMCMNLNDGKREVPRPRYIRRSRLRTGGAGSVPRTQAGLLGALWKRNSTIPPNAGAVALESVAGKIIDKVIDVCFVNDWKEKLAMELDSGLWLPTEADIEQYVPKVDAHKLERLVGESVAFEDEDLSRWLLMVKGMAKPPIDPEAHTKVQMPQTIMYSEQGTVNSKYSAMQTRFYKAFVSMLRPNVSFNNRDSPVDHEIWFNSCEGVRRSCSHVFATAGDITCYDRSQEHLCQVLELTLYRRMGLDEQTLLKWQETHGVKKATSMMLGVVIYLMMQGLSGIWKTLFRNGFLCLCAVVYGLDLDPGHLVTLDVVGDDFLVESTMAPRLDRAVDKFAYTFNFTAKLKSVEAMDMCSKFWVFVDGWWCYVQNPMRKIEAISNAVAVGPQENGKLREKWVSLRDDLRHYDNALVMEKLGRTVQEFYGFSYPPEGIIRALATWASREDLFLQLYGPEEVLA